MPDQNTCTDEQWADYVFNKDNQIAIVREWWMHTPSSYWFIAERHTASDEIIRTYDAKELFNQRVDFAIEQKQSQSQVPQQGVVA